MGECPVAHNPLENLRDLCVLRGEPRFQDGLLLFRFCHLVKRNTERRTAQGLTELMQRVPGGFAEPAGVGCGQAAAEGNLHLDADSANLAAPVLQHNDKFRHKLAQFCGDGGVGNGDAERAGLQAQYLAGLRKMGWRDTGKMAMQGRQGLCLGQQRTQFLIAGQQRFE